MLADPRAARHRRSCSAVARAGRRDLRPGDGRRSINDRRRRRSRAQSPTGRRTAARGRRGCGPIPRSARRSEPVRCSSCRTVEQVRYQVIVSDLYTTRERDARAASASTLIGAGLLALARLAGDRHARRAQPDGAARTAAAGRRAAWRRASSTSGRRARASSRSTSSAQQFNVMADRLSGIAAPARGGSRPAARVRRRRQPRAAHADRRAAPFTELQRDGEVDEATRREFLDRSTEQISRLEWMSTNLLDLSRIDAGIFPLDMRAGDLRDPVRAVVEAHARAAPSSGVALESSEVPAQPVMLRFDRERIVQLLTNLVGNALKFTPRGGEVSVALDGATRRRRASRCATRAPASRPPSCRTSSSASSAARTSARRGHRAAAWGSRSRARSSRCTAARSSSPARSGRARRSGSSCRGVRRTRRAPSGRREGQ